MNGQNWEEGDVEYHRWISAPTLLLHGRQDQLVSIEEEMEMVEVGREAERICGCSGTASWFGEGGGGDGVGWDGWFM